MSQPPGPTDRQRPQTTGWRGQATRIPQPIGQRPRRSRELGIRRRPRGECRLRPPAATNRHAKAVLPRQPRQPAKRRRIASHPLPLAAIAARGRQTTGRRPMPRTGRARQFHRAAAPAAQPRPPRRTLRPRRPPQERAKAPDEPMFASKTNSPAKHLCGECEKQHLRQPRDSRPGITRPAQQGAALPPPAGPLAHPQPPRADTGPDAG